MIDPKDINRLVHEANRNGMSQFEDMLRALNEERNTLRAALKPFADHADAWTRKGYGAADTLIEDGWAEGPAAAEGEPKHLDVTYLTVGHLLAARAAMTS